MEEIKKLNNTLRNQSWRFAKTMPYMPHYYVWIDKWTSQEDLEYCVNAITKFGTWEFFMKEPRHYYYVDGWRYWWMNGSDNTPIVINRERSDIRNPKKIPEKFL
tara:strand:+ start:69 stop:380 length:312 start_codon:yes stop_codon:yes gene_type:complete